MTATAAPVPSPAARTAASAAAWAVVALTGALATGPNIPWYDSLDLPRWRPPKALFGPVWTTLYTMLAASTAILANAPHSRDRATALRWYAANAAFNAAWSWLFFGFHLLVPAALEIAVILATAVGMVVAAWRVSRRAAALVPPYVAWVSFATVLNADVARRNARGTPRPAA